MDSKTHPSHPLEQPVGLEAADQRAPRVKFSTLAERNIFIRKFFCLLIIQMTITVVVTNVLYEYGTNHIKVGRHGLLFWWMSVIVLLLVVIIIFCLGDGLRSWPLNLIGLSLLTAAFSVFLGCTSAFILVKGTMISCILVIIVLSCLIVTTFISEINFTVRLVILPLVIIIILCSLGSFYLASWGEFIYQGEILAFFSSVGAVVFCSYIVIKTQDMVLNTHDHFVEPHEFIFATIVLYTDIFNLLVFVLSLVGSKPT